MRTTHRGNYIERTDVMRCEQDGRFHSGVAITLDTTLKRLRPAHLQQAVACFIRPGINGSRAQSTEGRCHEATTDGSVSQSIRFVTIRFRKLKCVHGHFFRHRPGIRRELGRHEAEFHITYWYSLHDAIYFK